MMQPPLVDDSKSNSNSNSCSSILKDGWQRLLFESRMPPDYKPPPQPEIDTSRLVSGELWGVPRPLGSTEDVERTNRAAAATQPFSEQGSSIMELDSPHGADSSPSLMGDAFPARNRDETNDPIEMEATRASPVVSDPYRGAPIMPTFAQESPKQALNGLYGKRMPQTPITNDAYFYWSKCGYDDSLPPFTCVLVCPATYELFPAGRYQSITITKSGRSMEASVDEKTGLVWYSRRKEAAQGAAALRYDCWYYREWLKVNPHAPKMRHFGLDDPYAYASEDDERLLRIRSQLPEEVAEDIDKKIAEWKHAAEKREREEAHTTMQIAQEEEHEARMEAEDTNYRESWREARSGTFAVQEVADHTASN